jgi:nitrite reductase/ring-hydroxylating ferredoxin subunit
MSQRLCKVSEVTEKGREFRVSGEKGSSYLMLFRRSERVLAYYNICPHENRSLNWAPDKFIVGDDGLLVCAHHGAAFELDSGKCLQGPCAGKSLRACAVSIRDGVVWLDS